MSKEFKEKREALKLSLKEVSKLTRVKTSYLDAIENSDFDKLPVEVYSKGYIREYAKSLDISADKILSEYNDYLETKRGGKKKEVPEKTNLQDAVATAPAQEPKTEPYHTTGIPVYTSTQAKNTAYRAILIVPFLFSVVISYFYLFNEKEPEMPVKTYQTVPAQSPVAAQQQETPASAEQTTPAANQTPAAVIQTAVTAQKPQAVVDNNTKKDRPAAVVKKKHNVDITATDEVWVLVIRDGVEKDSMIMKSGEKQSYSAEKSFFLKIGNAAGVKLTYNGKPISNLGGSGQVVTLILPQNASPSGQSTSSAATSPVN
ncbi:MAG: helix-turn-helix domain-containing protein [Nitrospirae bacterium]|nr:MAG: helix-turn-helix domain-containing protein [Nitrospirota bacterium]